MRHTRSAVTLMAALFLMLAGMIPVQATIDQSDFLSPEEAFQYELVPDGDQYRLEWEIADDYYLYRKRMTVTGQDADPADVSYPEGEIITDEYFGESEVYYGQAEVMIDPGEVQTLELSWQGCADEGLCYPPQNATVTLDGEPASANGSDGGDPDAAQSVDPSPQAEDEYLAGSLADSSLAWNLALFFGLGLLLVFTPCVLPMVPILSAVIVGSQAGRGRAFQLSLAFVVTMAATYAVLGAVAGLIGANLQAAFQVPLFIGGLAVIFVLLALSMFGVYELQLPAFIRERLEAMNSRQTGGHLGGAALMGFFSALLASPCMTAPLAGALLYIAESGDAFNGGLGLFALGLGMGAPLVAFGTLGASFLPNPGTWMNGVKAVFGVILLGTAVWFLERILPAHVIMALWGVLAAIASALVLNAVRHAALAEPARALAAALALVVGLWGGLMLVGAAGGGGAPYSPLKPFVGGGEPAGTAGVAEEGMAGFEVIKSPRDLDQALASAGEQSRWTLLEFYADWCISCEVIEEEVFGDPEVQKALADVQLLQADVTANDSTDQALMDELKVVGPPTIMLIGPDGQERRGYRVTGEISSEAFLERLSATGASSL
ncbi:protein-disulfide reductase DsbD [Vreelandella utahensis]|uniref:protein-disulfide reductase DsbD n=1 Tax=Vreelandella halophila TaxID=86177 RepID=UPI0009868B9E|nr:protein-disulfide reductase DsbD [Halomonas utahensis]